MARKKVDERQGLLFDPGPPVERNKPVRPRFRLKQSELDEIKREVARGLDGDGPRAVAQRMRASLVVVTRLFGEAELELRKERFEREDNERSKRHDRDD